MEELYSQQIEETMSVQVAEMEREMEKDMENKLLEERKSTHGSFQENAWFSQNVKSMAHSSPQWERMEGYMKETIDMTIHKIARILYGDCNLEDHWKDIVGYNQLVVDLMKKDPKTTFIDQRKYKVDSHGVRYDL